ncbi:endonuclease/exonuclease/phosphatase family protein [Micromonosporaceae bacterium B7E4]
MTTALAGETTVMSWNIAGGALDLGSEAWADHVAISLADLVGMQEVCWYQVDDIEAALEDRTGDDWISHFGVADTTSWSCPGNFGQAMFVKSHLTPRDWTSAVYPKENGCDVDAEERAFQAVTVTLGSTAVRVFNTHLATSGNGGCQSSILLQQAVHWPNSIVMGDFNMRTDHPSIAAWSTAGFRNMHPNNYFTATNTPGDCDANPTVKIDYIWVRGSITRDFNLFPLCNDASDHRALVAGVTTP